MGFILLFFQMALADIIVQGDAEQGEVLAVTVVDEISKQSRRKRLLTMHQGIYRIAVDA